MTERRIVTLDQQVTTTVGQLEVINEHDSPANRLGMTAWEAPRNSNDDRLPHRELPDGSVLVRVNELTRAKVRELPPGAIVSYHDNPAINGTERIGQEMAEYEVIAMVIEHNAQGTIMIRAIRSPRTGETPRRLQTGESQGAWGTYRLADGSDKSEKIDAIATLQRMFHPQKGIEATQMLSTVFSLAPGGEQAPITSAGCFSHEKPKQAIPQNFLLGATQLARPILLDRDMPQALMRLRVADEGRIVTPLTSTRHDQLVTEARLLEVAYNVKALKMAAANPTGMGAGTQPERVMNALMETTLQLTDIAGNNGTIAQGKQVLRQHLGVRS